MIENILMSDEEKIFSNDNFELILDIDKVRLDNEFNLKNLSGNLKFKKQKCLRLTSLDISLVKKNKIYNKNDR